MFKDVDRDSEEYFERGSYTMGNGKNFEYNADLSANYSADFGKNVIFANTQWSFSERKYNYVEFKARGFASKMDYITHAKGICRRWSDGFLSPCLVRQSFLISTNFPMTIVICLMRLIELMLLLCLVMTRDGDIFWSAGIGWNVHKEHFMENVSALNQLRFRASTGYSGSQNFKFLSSDSNL